MSYLETAIINEKCYIPIDIKLPRKKSNSGIILLHGGIVNRKSLSRKEYSFAEYCCKELNTHVITPDIFGKTTINNENLMNANDFQLIVNSCIDFLHTKLGVEQISAFSHSLGSILLVNSLKSLNDIDSIVTYGGPTYYDVVGFYNKFIFKLLDKIKFLIGNNLDAENFMWVFDKETRNYYNNVMKNHEEYGTYTEKSFVNVDLLFEIFNIIPNIEADILAWNNPALLLFGTEDIVTKYSMKYYSDCYKNKNLETRLIHEGHHITPCRMENYELEKFQPMINFLKSQARA